MAQEIALIRPALVRRLILAATGPKGAPGMHGWREDIAAAARGESKPENLLYIMFAPHRGEPAEGHGVPRTLMQRQRGTRRTDRRTPRATRSTTPSSNGASPTTPHFSG